MAPLIVSNPNSSGKSNTLTDKEKCEAKGGKWRWDELNQRCILQTTQPQKFNIAGKEVSAEQYKRVKSEIPGTSTGSGGQVVTAEDKALARPKTDLKRRQEEAKGILGKPEQPIQSTEENKDVIGFAAEDIKQVIDGVEHIVVAAGTPITKQQAEMLGLTTDSPEIQQADLQSQAIALGATSSMGLGLMGKVSSPVANFLSKAASKGKIVKSTKGILQAPVKAKGISSFLKSNVGLLIGFAGLGSLKSITSNLLTAKVQRIEAEVSKLGEQLTKVPEASNLGFSLDESGKLFEYTQEKALEELEDIEESLQISETSLKTASIGQTLLKITGRYQTAQAEIDKQKREITVARAKILNQMANPSESLLDSREFFRGMISEDEI